MSKARAISGAAQPAVPETVRAAARGALGRCPACGAGRLFGRFLKPAESCDACGQPFHHHRADDFPPYLVMFAVGHLCGYGIYLAETRLEDVPLWLHAVLWPSLAIGLSLALLQPVKGAVIGLQYGLGMHGFGLRPDGRQETTGGAAGSGRAPEGVARRGGAPAHDAEP